MKIVAILFVLLILSSGCLDMTGSITKKDTADEMQANENLSCGEEDDVCTVNWDKVQNHQ